MTAPDIRRAVILDGYVDEPACLGVPPYLSPYPRYVAGALPCDVDYFTIDQLRKDPSILKAMDSADLVVSIAGVTVPGKYIGGTPATPEELAGYMARLTKPVKILGGPMAMFGAGSEGGKKAKRLEGKGFDVIATGDVEAVVAAYVTEGKSVDPALKRRSKDIAEWAIRGARIIQGHQDYPYTMIELETYRGCFRGTCSFCTERFYGRPDFRPIEDVVREVEALYMAGARYFRIGRQPDIMTYMTKDDGEFPRPDPDAIERLYSGIRNVAPALKVLHMDNANPGTIARYPEESRAILKTIVKYHTSGDVMAFGMETADPEVVKRNDLKAQPEEVLEAVRLVNEIGSVRGYSGLPELLPGLNFVHGLLGETKNTFRLNFEFLKRLLDEGLMVRRINVRQVMPFEGTAMAEAGDRIARKHKGIFHAYKEKIRKEIDMEMLRRVVPAGTLLREVRMELFEHGITFGRQLGSYPILVGVPDKADIGAVMDVKVIDHGYRSVTAAPYPMDINHASQKLIEFLPGVGKSRAAAIIRNRPFKDESAFIASMDDAKVARELSAYFEYK